MTIWGRFKTYTKTCTWNVVCGTSGWSSV